ncbi:MAG TPA: type II toxin-antitoxin system VapC family toxin [Pirellulaceae bacterium]
MRLYLDSNAIIIAYEGPPPVQQTVIERIIEACVLPDGLVLTSLLTRMECRVKPLRQQDFRLLANYDFMFGQFGVHVIDISAEIVERATQLRADHRFRTPDAIHLATAIESDVDVFLTRDKALAKCPGLNIELI